ncbi:hypothetical protein ASPACDRAFT_45652 [Aspergillus aculeatus ATCC 16872]|uniref:EKC/KEOPS complex subunit BUD32 n=1 Tax=Aspergillus aculeatus (strain ATCC 16872 / CBS 172.66 / WB 5094) TaxID=690307 RepID=A0A1L9WMZ6_ASPA1|nr:uncharacterized protein ASPACDRAFT_45652 [Aspergillus aculeatus ATCC 16872]OJJ97559.1 hypothetical protein ASPACDRAFT_45652 [Aspergillus aculeatus ATCC 16872]
MVADELELSPSEVTFLETFKEGESSLIFRVAVHGMDCVMKVFHEYTREEWDNPDEEISMCMREVTSYERLKAKGLCARGVIPDYYGYMTFTDLTLWPNLHMFTDDELPPKAILIEYVPGMKQLELINYTKSRVETLRNVLSEINAAKILHSDIAPRNMMVCSGETERVLWIDFDLSRVFPEDEPLTEEQQEWFEDEAALMDEFVDWLSQDAVEGKLHKAFRYYYGTYTYWKRIKMGLPGTPEPVLPGPVEHDEDIGGKQRNEDNEDDEDIEGIGFSKSWTSLSGTDMWTKCQ